MHLDVHQNQASTDTEYTRLNVLFNWSLFDETMLVQDVLQEETLTKQCPSQGCHANHAHLENIDGFSYGISKRHIFFFQFLLNTRRCEHYGALNTLM